MPAAEGLRPLRAVRPGDFRRSRAREVEAKFIVKTVSVQEALLRLGSLGPFQIVSRRRQRQRNTYLDTGGLRLRRARAALKLREVGRRAELTFKREVRYARGISERTEVTVPVRREQVQRLFTGGLEVRPVRCAQAIAGRGPLQVVLRLLTDREGIIFAWGRQRIELDLDRVTVRRIHGPVSRGKPVPRARGVAVYREVELENLSATPAAYRQALEALRRRFRKEIRPSRVPKYEMGLRLARVKSRAGRRNVRPLGYNIGRKIVRAVDR